MILLIRIEKEHPPSATMVGLVAKCWELISAFETKEEAEKYEQKIKGKFDKFVMIAQA